MKRLFLLLCLATGLVQAQNQAFRFVVFGDFNGGGCERNARVQALIDRVAQEPDIAFYVSTGDLIDGYAEADGRITSCFATDPASIDPANTCANAPNGSVKQMLAPLLNRAPVAGLGASFYPVLGNHDDNWGSNWYPDPCGDGICDLYDQDGGTPEFTLLNRYITDHSPGAVCSLDPATSDYPWYFYYRFEYRNSLFLMLRMNNDWYNMISSCNNLPPSHASCAAYCTDPALFNDPVRNANCYSVHQYDWLRTQLQQAQGQYEHIFVFAHAPLLGTGDNHGPTSDAPYLRELLESHGVDIYFNGHNHAYERSHKIRGNQLDPDGTAYITVGVAGALTDGNAGNAWFDAATYADWSTYNDQAGMTTYTVVTVNGPQVSLETRSMGRNWQVVDQASYGQPDLGFSDGFEGGTAGGTRSAPRLGGCYLFPDDNFWNTPIDNLPLHPDSASYIASIGATTPLHPDFGTTWNGQDIGIPFNIVPQGQARVPIRFTWWDESDLEAGQCNTGGAQDVGCYPIPPNPAIEGAPVDAGDRHVLVLEQGSCKLYETFATTKDASGMWTAGSGAIWNLDLNQARPPGWTSADASGLAILPGLVRYDEVMVEGEIRHAIRFTLDTIRSAYIPPASHSDGQGGCSTSLPAMGQRFRLKAGFDISGFSQPVQVILQAMKTYGIVLADTGADMFITGEHHDNWDDGMLAELGQVTAGDFEAVFHGDALGYGSCP